MYAGEGGRGGSRYQIATCLPTLVGCLGPQSKNALPVAIKYYNNCIMIASYIGCLVGFKVRAKWGLVSSKKYHGAP